MSSNGWIGVDLDGTLAHYDGWKGEHHIGAPIPAMVDRVKGWLAAGREVRIFTARVADMPQEKTLAKRDVESVRLSIQRWCAQHIGVSLPVTNVKDFHMEVLFDDRARQVEFNTGEVLGTGW